MDNPIVPVNPLLPTQTKVCVYPSPGETITSQQTGNTYVIGDRIGEGNFSVVYSCHDTWNNELAAKVLKPHGTYEKVRDSAIAELQKLTTLRHPNITYVYDAFEFRNAFFLIVERCFCPLKDLFLMSNFNGNDWLFPIARCLLQAVNYSHLHGFVHQDIHTGNVFTAFAKDEMPAPTKAKAIQFRLADFGVAKLLSEVDAVNTRANWMLPPEVLDSKEYGPTDHRIDIYHLGLLFLQLALSRELQFTPEETLQGKPREMAETLPPPLNFALSKALRRHVASRTNSAMELWRDLRFSMSETSPTP